MRSVDTFEDARQTLLRVVLFAVPLFVAAHAVFAQSPAAPPAAPGTPPPSAARSIPSSSAEALPPKAEVASLLDGGWPRSLDARRAAQDRYAALAQTYPGSPALAYAMALVELRQGRYSDALRLIDEVLKANPADVAALRIRIWLAAILKRYDRAIADLAQLGQVLRPTRDSAVDAAEEAARRDLAVFLGRIVGFMEGPVAKDVDGAALKQAVASVTASLDSPQQQVFEGARQEVVSGHAAAKEETAATTAAAQLESIQRREKVVGDLSKQSDAAAANAQSVAAAADAARQKLEDEAVQVRDSITRVTRDLAVVESQSRAARSDLFDIEARLSGLYTAADYEPDPYRRALLLSEADRLERDHDRIVGQVRSLDQSSAGLRAEGTALDRRRNEIQNTLDDNADRVAKAKRTADRTAGALRTAENRPISRVNAEVLDQQRRAQALTTYLPRPLSLEAERDRLLTTLR